MAKWGALANFDYDQALADIANGAISKHIAKKYGVTDGAIRNALRRNRPDEYREAVASQVEHWVFDSADEMHELENDAVSIARARARGDFRLKLAAKLHPDFADKQQITQVSLTVIASESLSGMASELLSRVRGRTIEHDAQQQSHALVNKQADST